MAKRQKALALKILSVMVPATTFKRVEAEVDRRNFKGVGYTRRSDVAREALAAGLDQIEKTKGSNTLPPAR